MTRLFHTALALSAAAAFEATDRVHYFTCRHNYEHVLVDELNHLVGAPASACSSPAPAIVRVNAAWADRVAELDPICT